MSLSRFKIGYAREQAASSEETVSDETGGFESKKPESRLGRNALMAGAAALPFAGMIGDAPNIHEGKGQEFHSLADLKKTVRPGDMLISSPHKKSFTNLAIGLGTGVPDATHAAFVDDRGRIISNTLEANSAGPTVQKFEEGRAYTVLRPKAGGPLDAADMAKKYRRHLDVATALEAAEKARGATPEAIATMRRDFYSRAPGYLKTPFHSVIAPNFGSHGAGDEAKKMFDAFAKKPIPGKIQDCASGWCTQPGAMAFPKGVDVVAGRKPGDTTPVDFLKSPHLEAVGGYGRGKNRYVDKMIRAGPTAARLTYGALGALGVYGASKGLDAMKKRTKETQEPLREIRENSPKPPMITGG